MKIFKFLTLTFRDFFAMKKSRLTKLSCILYIALLCSNFGFSQIEKPYLLEKNFGEKLFTAKSSEISLQVSATKNYSATINVKKGTTDNYTIIGKIGTNAASRFNITKQNGKISGEIYLLDQKKAYRYYSGENNEVFIKEENINNLLCIDFEKSISKQNDDTGITFSKVAPDLQSLPGSEFIIYIDFDGELVTNTSWHSSGTIDAQATNYSDEKITNIWRIMAEDFAPFNVNVTTNRALFDAAPNNQRIMCIFTPTKDAAPTAGGVAYLNSFSSSGNEPCWVYNSDTRSAGETGSHEVGHTLGLSHDGTKSGTTYYSGHGEWSPIMGWSVNKTLGHWSIGEYNDANQQQDDLAIMANDRNGFGYKQDDHGDVISEASELVTSSDGTVLASENTNLISTRNDKDVFSIIASAGEVSLNFEPNPHYPNLNIQARLLNATGEELAISSPTTNLSASISTTVESGTYFIEVDGVGEGDLSTGYSDYSSLGVYSISGSYTLGDNNQPPVSNFEAIIECDQVTFKSTSINVVTSYSWDFGDGTTSTEQNPTHTYTASGIYTISLTATNDHGSDTNTKSNFINIEIASIPDAANAAVCGGEPATISLTGSNGYIWYDQQTNGTVINTGATYTTPVLTENTTYYVSGTTKPITEATVGLEEINAADGNIHAGGFYLIFDALEPISLEKAKVSAETAGNRTLELRNAAGDIIETKTINIPAGESIIDINLTIPIGDNLQIGFAEDSNLFRNNQNVNYPYDVSGVVSIKNSTATDAPGDYYYYLYDWQISTLGGCTTTERATVTVSVSEAPSEPVITLNDQTGEITVSQQFDAYQWYRDDAVIEGATGDSYTPTENGSYSLRVFNTAGCGTLSQSITIGTLSITDITSQEFAITIYPNPTNEVLYIDGLSNLTEEVNNITIVNTLGQIIKKYTNPISKLDTRDLGEGMYFLRINNKITKSFIKSSFN